MDELKANARLYEIFKRENWIQNEGCEQVYNNFVLLTSHLTDEQGQLLVELVDRYKWLTFSEYHPLLIKVLRSIDIAKLKSIKRVILFPLMKKEHEDNIKSGHVILHPVKTILSRMKSFKKIKIQEFLRYDNVLADDFKLDDTDLIFLIDDFLGSGETLHATINKLLENKGICLDKINIISIAAQQAVIDSLIDKKISLYKGFVLKKGISDYYTGEGLVENTTIMQRIEDLIPGNHFQFGYEGSESLLSFDIKTPDNTFPIFWEEHRYKSKKYNAPFQLEF